MKALLIAMVSVGIGLHSINPVNAQTKLKKAAVAPAKVDRNLLGLQAFARKVKAVRAQLNKAYQSYAKALRAEQASAAKAPTLRLPNNLIRRVHSRSVIQTSKTRSAWFRALAAFKSLRHTVGGVAGKHGAFRGCMIENKHRPYGQRVKFCRASARAYAQAAKALRMNGMRWNSSTKRWESH